MNVTVRNVITSMRTMATFDWAEFFESVSLVDAALRAGSNFGAMDFATRDRYRHAIEDLARGSRRTDLEVAQEAIARAERAASEGERGAPAGSRAEDPGYYLISKGRRGFERELGYRVPLTQWLLRAYVGGATPGYLGTIGVIAGLLAVVPLVATHAAGVSPIVLVLLGFAALIPASDLAVALINRVVTELLGPRALPRLELAEGIPAALRTLVVMPTLLVSDAEIEEQVESPGAPLSSESGGRRPLRSPLGLDGRAGGKHAG